LLADLAERSGLGADLSAALAPLVKAPRRHAPGEVLVDLAVMLADGGECVLDLKTLRGQPGLFGEVASQPTAWRLLDAIDQDMLAGLQAARAASRARAWAAGLAPAKLTLDFDATLVNLHSIGLGTGSLGLNPVGPGRMQHLEGRGSSRSLRLL
jgi:hypothetical protein